ncbi:MULTISPECIES: (2Fe-2S)-binding protein [unclassified Ralstonia]|uniref:(2Fe-2S)-binding protein n=1 Tax=unclassified Ralstonia TaxID=209769 RepID=UPI002C75833F|nr:(2Fe-2S)-binding protein [Ralstonia sp.]
MTRSKLTPEPDEPQAHLSLIVNGQIVERTVPVRMLLSDFLRHELGLTGTHVGCEQGHCGCCTVQIDGRAARSCLTLAVQAAGASVRTIESVADADGGLHPFQQALLDCHALQCGFCTPGIVMSVLGYLKDIAPSNLPLSDEALHEAISGHLCRCTGYVPIMQAVHRAAQHANTEAVNQLEATDAHTAPRQPESAR